MHACCVLHVDVVAFMLHVNMVAFMLRVNRRVDLDAFMLHDNMHVAMLQVNMVAHMLVRVQTCFMCHLQLRYVEPPVAAMLLDWPSEQHNVV